MDADKHGSWPQMVGMKILIPKTVYDSAELDFGVLKAEEKSQLQAGGM